MRERKRGRERERESEADDTKNKKKMTDCKRKSDMRLSRERDECSGDGKGHKHTIAMGSAATETYTGFISTPELSGLSLWGKPSEQRKKQRKQRNRVWFVTRYLDTGGRSTCQIVVSCAVILAF